MRLGAGRMRSFVSIVQILVVANEAPAQQLRGIVRDSLTRQPIPAAVVILQDSAARQVSRSVTNDRGEYELPLSSSVRFVRVLRLGFRPRDLAIPAASDAGRVDIVMMPVPTLLDPVRLIVGTRCPRVPDQAAAVALLEQARAGLLSTIVARETHVARLLVLKFIRTMDGTSDRIARQEVRMESTLPVAKSFEAVRSARDVVRLGFTAGSGEATRFFGVDADVLLDSSFADSYCFRIHQPDSARPNQIGLSFARPTSRSGRTDIDGTLWIDTAARVLRDIEYRYVGFGRTIETERPGGRTHFHQMPNGVVAIDRWSLRAVFSETDTISGDERSRWQRQVRTVLSAVETGGELAEATWLDGVSWRGNLGRLVVHGKSRDHGAPLGTEVRLVGTDYIAAVDSTGGFSIPHLVPGPYSLSVVDPRLSPLGIDVPTSFKFVAARDSVVDMTTDLPTTEEFVADRCRTARFYDGATRSYILGRATTPAGEPVEDAVISVLRSFGAGDWRPIRVRMRTDAEGLFQFCTADLEPGETVIVRATWRDGSSSDVKQRLERLSVVRVVAEPRF